MKYIFLHGLGQTASSWDETINLLNKNLDISCPNLSDWINNDDCSFDALYQALESYCQQFDDLCLVGLSLGGMLAMRYAIEHSEKVSSLVLIGTQFKMPKRLLKLQNIVFRFMPNSTFSKMGFSKSNFISLCDSMMDIDYSSSLKNIKCDVLVVCGENDRANLSASSLLSKTLDNAKMILIQNSGHEVNLDNATKLAEELDKFL